MSLLLYRFVYFVLKFDGLFTPFVFTRVDGMVVSLIFSNPGSMDSNLELPLYFEAPSLEDSD